MKSIYKDETTGLEFEREGSYHIAVLRDKILIAKYRKQDFRNDYIWDNMGCTWNMKNLIVTCHCIARYLERTGKLNSF